MTPEEVVTDLLPSMPEGAFITAALVAVTYSIPGAKDSQERGPFLRWSCDGEAGRWVHLGMAETIAAGCRRTLDTYDMDD